MKRLALAISCLVLLSSCDGFTESSSRGSTSEIIYVKDYRTDLCFAWSWPFYDSPVMTEVPCTPEVLSLIQQAEAAG